ncbi:MAG: diadenylate cyclase [Bacilli bacterium]|nr:diadenylate cyclase [Bacilli bacterium]
MPTFLIAYLETPAQIADLILSIVFLAGIIFLAVKCKFSIFTIASLFALFILKVVLGLFAMELSSYFVLIFTISVLIIASISHIGTIRVLFSRNFKPALVSKKSGPDKLINRDALYNEIYEAVLACSRQKIGALITFEKHDDLTNVMKNGTVINAPVKSELLMTIFYPGTRLHDGAVIIKENMIYAASVYYTPTTRALTGKYGSRHRAAIGISEMSDSITVVVSEETGRVSIAKGGEIEPVSLDDFVTTLSDSIAEGE